jgi:hypothetical protein
MAWTTTGLPEASTSQCAAAAHAATIVGMLGAVNSEDGAAAARAAASLEEGSAQEIAAVGHGSCTIAAEALRRLLAYGWGPYPLTLSEPITLQAGESALAHAVGKTKYYGFVSTRERVAFGSNPQYKDSYALKRIWCPSEPTLITVTARRMICVTKPNPFKGALGVLSNFKHAANFVIATTEFSPQEIQSIALVQGGMAIQLQRRSVATPWRLELAAAPLLLELLAHLSGVRPASTNRN